MPEIEDKVDFPFLFYFLHHIITYLLIKVNALLGWIKERFDGDSKNNAQEIRVRHFNHIATIKRPQIANYSEIRFRTEILEKKSLDWCFYSTKISKPRFRVCFLFEVKNSSIGLHPAFQREAKVPREPSSRSHAEKAPVTNRLTHSQHNEEPFRN